MDNHLNFTKAEYKTLEKMLRKTWSVRGSNNFTRWYVLNYPERLKDEVEEMLKDLQFPEKANYQNVDWRLIVQIDDFSKWADIAIEQGFVKKEDFKNKLSTFFSNLKDFKMYAKNIDKLNYVIQIKEEVSEWKRNYMEPAEIAERVLEEFNGNQLANNILNQFDNVKSTSLNEIFISRLYEEGYTDNEVKKIMSNKNRLLEALEKFTIQKPSNENIVKLTRELFRSNATTAQRRDLAMNHPDVFWETMFWNKAIEGDFSNFPMTIQFRPVDEYRKEFEKDSKREADLDSKYERNEL